MLTDLVKSDKRSSLSCVHRPHFKSAFLILLHSDDSPSCSSNIPVNEQRNHSKNSFQNLESSIRRNSVPLVYQ
ncbi:hypothetical protein BDZ91DRAFT_716716 [Kalaharituber pfeilii]|nr:hypothetical protein BDZ91DRAFT_716716 [Kalaharituber pfeilii]